MYKTKKTLSVVLAGATAVSMIAATAATASAATYFTPDDTTTYGVIGEFNAWDGDIALTDDDNDGIYTATVTVPEAGSAYKVRANAGWTYSWGAVDEKGLTGNSQTNCSFTEDQFGTDVTVYFDTRTGAAGSDTWYVGTEEPSAEAPVVPEEPSSEEPSSEVPVAPAGKYDAAYEAAKAQLGEENMSKYYFFDNSETQWTTVGAYWWTPAENAPWPGQEAVQIEGTDIWAVEYDAGTTAIIFNNMVSDDEYTKDNPKAQMPDTAVTPDTNGGLIFVPDMATLNSSEDDKGTVIKVDGNWTTFQGTVVEPDESSKPADDSKKPADESSKSDGNNNNSSKSDGKGVNTGDSTAPIAIAAVFAAAALTAVVLMKKKEA